jgi:hypothetical protein
MSIVSIWRRTLAEVVVSVEPDRPTQPGTKPRPGQDVDVEQEVSWLAFAVGPAPLAAHPELCSVRDAGRNDNRQFALDFDTALAVAASTCAVRLLRLVCSRSILPAAAATHWTRLADLVRDEGAAALAPLGSANSDRRLDVLAASQPLWRLGRSSVLLRLSSRRAEWDNDQVLERVEEMIESVA